MIMALAFLLTMSVLVTVHEYGHYQVAKWCGVKILKFSIGFGKPLWIKPFGVDKTEFVIAAIPLGGYVKMLDEREMAAESTLESPAVTYSEAELMRAFNRQSVAKRIAIVIAGPMANLLLAIGLYWILFMMGIVGMKPVLGNVIAQSPAAVANFTYGETIQKINGKEVASWQDVSWLLLNESLKNSNVEVETVNSSHEVHLHQLDLSGIDQEAAAKDILTESGLTIDQPDIPAKIGIVTKNGIADLASLKVNDLVLRVNKTKISVWEDFVQEVRQSPNKKLEIEIQRNSSVLNIAIKPEQFTENGKKFGRIGVAFKMDEATQDKLFITTHYSASAALIKATEKTWDISVFTLKMLGKMFTGQVSLKGVSGPLTIASYAGQSAQMGLNVFVGFLALISISIGVLNLLPIPVLDGGHLMYYIVEIFTGKPTSDFALNIGQRVGFFLLGCMMILAFYNDINRLITG
ncbi:RIP metalloprotease RseP [Methylotenera sp.]|uniref:RIP metalloprotease RseP n=1 Tax=Methylotenera sp. TaxID=2051956 RepID=UPI00248A22F6|nr:RIP metalloprotease RseP [Methylotenera sp.]MDI1299614.1 RIP metalloprotease RseP [Methylotenera sp.]